MTKIANSHSLRAMIAATSTPDLPTHLMKGTGQGAATSNALEVGRSVTDQEAVVSTSLSNRISDSLRPKLNGQATYEPLRLRAALGRLSRALERLRLENDSLLRTADQILTEEQLRVEILRDRLQNVVKG